MSLPIPVHLLTFVFIGRLRLSPAAQCFVWDGGLLTGKHWIGPQIWGWTVKPWNGHVSWPWPLGLAGRLLPVNLSLLVSPSQTSFLWGSRRSCHLGHTCFQQSDQRQKDRLPSSHAWHILVKGQRLTWLGLVPTQGPTRVPRGMVNSDQLSVGQEPFPKVLCN